MKKKQQVHVPIRQPEALWDSVLIAALALPRSGEASRAAVGLWLPWCHTTAVANVVFFFFQWRKLTFPEALLANHPSFSPNQKIPNGG